MYRRLRTRSTRALAGLLVAFALSGIGIALNSQRATAVQACAKGYFIDGPSPSCDPGCSGTCGCAICPDIPEG